MIHANLGASRGYNIISVSYNNPTFVARTAIRTQDVSTVLIAKQ